jgi:hypothetical protein
MSNQPIGDRVEIPPDALPPRAHAFVSELMRRGYEVAAARYEPEHHGDAKVVLERDGTRIRLVRDRGELLLEVSGAGWSDWFEPLAWRTFLTATAPLPNMAGFDAELPFLREDLPRIEAAIPEVDIAKLNQLRKIRANRTAAYRAPGA